MTLTSDIDLHLLTPRLATAFLSSQCPILTRRITRPPKMSTIHQITRPHLWKFHFGHTSIYGSVNFWSFPRPRAGQTHLPPFELQDVLSAQHKCASHTPLCPHNAITTPRHISHITFCTIWPHSCFAQFSQFFKNPSYHPHRPKMVCY